MFYSISDQLSPAVDGLTLAGIATAVAITVIVCYLHRCSTPKTDR